MEFNREIEAMDGDYDIQLSIVKTEPIDTGFDIKIEVDNNDYYNTENERILDGNKQMHEDSQRNEEGNPQNSSTEVEQIQSQETLEIEPMDQDTQNNKVGNAHNIFTEIDKIQYQQTLQIEQTGNDSQNSKLENVQTILTRFEQIQSKETLIGAECLMDENMFVGNHELMEEIPVKKTRRPLKKFLLKRPILERRNKKRLGKVAAKKSKQLNDKSKKKTKLKAKKKSKGINGTKEDPIDVKKDKTDEESEPKKSEKDSDVNEEKVSTKKGKKGKTKKLPKEKKDGEYDLVENRATCRICNKELAYSCNMNRHLKTAACMAKQTELCIAKEDGDATVAMAIALLTTPNEKKYIDCPVCGKKMASVTSIKRHIRTVHAIDKPEISRNVPCNHVGCARLFDSAASMRKHYNAVHLDIRKYLCEICSSMFKTGNALKIHMLTIHNRPGDGVVVRFDCPVCNRSFSSNAKLRAHSTVHTGDKPYKCEVEGCNKQFRLKTTQKKHMQIFHQDMKPYVCEICDQAFSRKIYLTTHQYKHTGLKMFKCNICSKTFSQKGNLNVHMKQHSNFESPYKCKICDKAYLTKHTLYHHRRSKHNIHEADPDYMGEIKMEADKNDEISMFAFDLPT